jgi:hypothetical protein
MSMVGCQVSRGGVQSYIDFGKKIDILKGNDCIFLTDVRAFKKCQNLTFKVNFLCQKSTFVFLFLFWRYRNVLRVELLKYLKICVRSLQFSSIKFLHLVFLLYPWFQNIPIVNQGKNCLETSFLDCFTKSMPLVILFLETLYGIRLVTWPIS